MKQFGFKLIIVLLGILVISPAAQARGRLLENPEREEWGCKLSLSQVQSGIRRAMRRKQWIGKNLGPGHMEGKLLVRKHKLYVNIKFNTRSYHVTYKKSMNLSEQKTDEGIRVHAHVNKWMRQLSNYISVYLSEKCE